MAVMARDQWTDERLDDLNARVESIERIMYREIRAMREKTREEVRALRADFNEELRALQRQR